MTSPNLCCALLVVRIDFADDDEAEAHWEFLPVGDRITAIDTLLDEQGAEYIVTDGDRYIEIRGLRHLWHKGRVKRSLRVRIYCSDTDDWKSWTLQSHESIRHKPSIRGEGVITSGIYAGEA